MPLALRTALQSTSRATRWVLAGVCLLVVLIALGIHLLHVRVEAGLTKEQEQLRIENRQITDNYQQKLGEAHANETAAREDALKATALLDEYKRRMGNIKALDQQIKTVEEKHEADKANLGECTDDNDCLARLRAELCRAGFKTACD